MNSGRWSADLASRHQLPCAPVEQDGAGRFDAVRGRWSVENRCWSADSQHSVREEERRTLDNKKEEVVKEDGKHAAVNATQDHEGRSMVSMSEQPDWCGVGGGSESIFLFISTEALQPLSDLAGAAASPEQVM